MAYLFVFLSTLIFCLKKISKLFKEFLLFIVLIYSCKMIFLSTQAEKRKKHELLKINGAFVCIFVYFNLIFYLEENLKII